jgi:hypothetical protein
MLSVTVVDYASKPIELVKREMVDLDFHERGHVHPNIKFTLLAQDANSIRFRQEVKIWGLLQVDEIILREAPDGKVVQDVIAGTNKGAQITFAFQSEGRQFTKAEVTIDLPLKGMKRLLRPLVRWAVHRSASKGLREDMQSLETGSYEKFLAKSAKRGRDQL